MSNLFSKKINFWLLTAVLLVRAFVKLLYVMESFDELKLEDGEP